MDVVPAAAEAHCHMDDLPDEIFTQILNLLPIRHVIRCATVSERWYAACRYNIRTRESLVIGDDSEHQHDSNKKRQWRRRLSQQMDGITLKDMRLISDMLTCVNQMEELMQLRVTTCGTPLADFSRFFVWKFAEQLTLLEIDFPVRMVGAHTFPHLTRLRCRLFDANRYAAFPMLAELFVCGMTKREKMSNMRLSNLKKLLITPMQTGNNLDPNNAGDAEMVREFLLANAESLTILQMSGIPLRVDPAIVFPNLMKVDCWSVDAGTHPFPALTHLTVGESVTAEFLSSLPAGQMLSLDVAFEREDVVPAISNMKSLKSLKLAGSKLGETDGKLSSMFESLHHLEKVRLVAHQCRDNGMIATLANQNPKLRHLFFNRINVTDADLTSLALLQNLTEIWLYQGRNITTAGILTLLRGSSRNVIRKIVLSGDNVDDDQVRSEISLMCEERGTTFFASHTDYISIYVIHA